MIVKYNYYVSLWNLFISSSMLFDDFWLQAVYGIRGLVLSRGLGDVYKRQNLESLLISILLSHGSIIINQEPGIMLIGIPIVLLVESTVLKELLHPLSYKDENPCFQALCLIIKSIINILVLIVLSN